MLNPKQPQKVLDHGYVRLVEAWGHGDAGKEFHSIYGDEEPADMECGIIEAARQSTQASFRGWEDKKCEACGDGKVHRISTAWCPECNGKGYLPGDARLLKTLFTGKPQHVTPFEFSGMVIEVQAPIFVYREWHRHRTQSYNEMSARYAPLPDLNYVPDWNVLKARGEAGEKTRNKQAAGTHPWDEEKARRWWEGLPAVNELLERFYQQGLECGVPKEIARIDLPVARYSRMRACTNLRNWLAFMTLRADPQAQWEIQQFAHAVGRIIENQFPRTWGLFSDMRDNPLARYDLKTLQAECDRRIAELAGPKPSA